MPILSQSKTKLSFVLTLALLCASAANAETNENAGTVKNDPAAKEAAGPSKTGTVETRGLPYASSPETAAPGVSPKIPAKDASQANPKTGLPGAVSPPAAAEPQLPGTVLPEDGLTTPTTPGTSDSPTAPTQPVPGDTKAHQPPPSNGKPQIGLQFPAKKQLAVFLRVDPSVAVYRIKVAEARCRKQLVAAGMDPTISIDDAMELSKPVINIYLKKSVGDNILAHGFCLQAFLCQYRRMPSGRVENVRSFRIGESPEVYTGADFEDKAVNLVDAYISARHHQIKATAAAGAKKGKPAAKGKKTK